MASQLESWAQAAIRDTGGRATGLRVALLAWLHERGAGATQSEIESALGGLGDRVSLYRALDWFVDQGLVHRVASPGRAAIYAVGPGLRHVHFTCRGCGRSQCLGEAALRPPRLPAGYVRETMEVVVSGLCADCS